MQRGVDAKITIGGSSRSTVPYVHYVVRPFLVCFSRQQRNLGIFDYFQLAFLHYDNILIEFRGNYHTNNYLFFSTSIHPAP